MDQINQELIKALQDSLPFEENPYAAIGKILGISEDEVIERLKIMKDSNKLKRISAILRHEKSGYTNNAMVVFKTEAAMTENIGKELSSSPLVSHCYERKSYEKWPYNLYAMLHSRNEYEIEAFVESIVKKYGIDIWEILYSVKELKKTSMIYHISSR
jgi:DNA-binding Lrp family transcriptional regulator